MANDLEIPILQLPERAPYCEDIVFLRGEYPQENKIPKCFFNFQNKYYRLSNLWFQNGVQKLIGQESKKYYILIDKTLMSLNSDIDFELVMAALRYYSHGGTAQHQTETNVVGWALYSWFTIVNEDYVHIEKEAI